MTQALERAQLAGFGVLVNGDLTGSGIIIDPSGIAVTAAHQVLEKEKTLEARSTTLGRLALKVIATDLGNDLALLELPKRKEGYPYMPVAADQPSVGSQLFLVGSPIYRHNLLMRGSVARKRAGYEYFAGRRHYIRVIYVSGPSPAGTSGGGWITESGQLVGVQIGLMHTGHDGGRSPVGIGYMAPVDSLRNLMKNRRNVLRASLMIGLEEFWEQDDEYRSRYPAGQEGLVVAKMSPDTPAMKAGLKVGDLVVAVDGRPAVYRDGAIAQIRDRETGGTIRLTILGLAGIKKEISIPLSAL